jgi:hypothetical protein
LQCWYAIHTFNREAYGDVFAVGGGECVGQNPFEDAKNPSGIKKTVYFRIDVWKGGRMNRCFDGIDGDEAIRREWDILKVGSA